MSRFRLALERAGVEPAPRTERAPRRRAAQWSSSPAVPPEPNKEAYARIVQSLVQLPLSERPQSILVASAAEGEGASTVARGLARAFAELGADETLLVDANLRAPSQHVAFDLPRSGGLSEIVVEVADANEVVHPMARGLSVMTAGRPARSPAQVLSLPGLTRTVKNVRRQYGWIMVDAPAVTVYSDAARLAGIVDGVILVVRAEHTRWEVADKAKSLLMEGGARILGAVLNRRRYHIPAIIYRRI